VGKKLETNGAFPVSKFWVPLGAARDPRVGKCGQGGKKWVNQAGMAGTLRDVGK